jgi:hypothetical protein
MLFRQNAKHSTYQTNSFLSDGSIVVCERDNEQIRFAAVRPDEKEFEIVRFEGDRPAYYDTSRMRDIIIILWQGNIWMADSRSSSRMPRMFYSPPEGAAQLSHCAISSAGGRILAPVRYGDGSHCLCLDTVTGHGRELFHMSGEMHHVHFCPADEQWVGYCALNNRGEIMGIYVWNPVDAPDGIRLFEPQRMQQSEQSIPGYIRWAHHDILLYAALCLEGVCGIWAFYTDGRPAELILQDNSIRAFDIDREGKYLALDRQIAEANQEAIPHQWDIALFNMQSGEITSIAHASSRDSHISPETIFSPDGKELYYHDYEQGGEKEIVNLMRVTLSHNDEITA